MKRPDYNEVLLETIKQKLPEGTSPVAFLMDMLCVGKEAAYRRLRGEVSITIDEAVQIAKKLGISIDGLMEIGDEKRVAFYMQLPNFNNPSEVDYNTLQEYIDEVRLAATTADSHLNIATNTIPQQLYLQYDNLTRFFLFMRAYNQMEKTIKPYSEIESTQRLKQIFSDSFEAHTRFKFIRFVLDKHILHYLIDSIRYFYHIELITNEEVQLIREDLFNMLNYLEKIAITGRNENGAEVSLYISNVNFDKNCTTIKIGNRYISVVETYILNGIGTNNKADYDRMEEWIFSRCRLSTMISCCGDMHRIAFFKKQRSLLDTLLDGE